MARLLDPGVQLNAPHLLDVEVAQVLRRYERAGDLTAGRAREWLDDLLALPLHRYAHDLLLPAAWDRRGHLSCHDGV